jgi:hypothetical protein
VCILPYAARTTHASRTFYHLPCVCVCVCGRGDFPCLNKGLSHVRSSCAMTSRASVTTMGLGISPVVVRSYMTCKFAFGPTGDTVSDSGRDDPSLCITMLWRCPHMLAFSPVYGANSRYIKRNARPPWTLRLKGTGYCSTARRLVVSDYLLNITPSCLLNR